MIYNQRDTRWANEKLGFGQTNIGNFGCTISCVSQILLLNGYNETPSTVNQKLKAVNGYAGTNRNLIIWDKLKEAYPNIITNVERIYYYSNVKAVEAITANKGVLVRVDGAKIGAPEHWVTYVGGGKLYDPWNGVERATSYYPANGMAIISIKPNTGGGNMDFIDLKKRLSDKHWSELKEFEDLRKLGLIDRPDSIQTMTQKWIKSYTIQTTAVEILDGWIVKLKGENEVLREQNTSGIKYAQKMEGERNIWKGKYNTVVKEFNDYKKEFNNGVSEESKERIWQEAHEFMAEQLGLSYQYGKDNLASLVLAKIEKHKKPNPFEQFISYLKDLWTKPQ